MTDPNTEVILSSDLFDDDPCLENMSASALAVLDAYMVGYGWLDSPTKKDCRGVAAALRAAAGQLAYAHGSWAGSSAIINEDELLAIADELDSTST